MSSVLLTVSGLIPEHATEEVELGSRPRADYLEISAVLDADLLDRRRARRSHPYAAALLAKFGSENLLLAWACFRLRLAYDAIITDGEQVGIPLAFLLKFGAPLRARPRHLMIVHILSVRKKLPFFDLLRVHSHIDRLIVYSTWQQRFIEERWNLPRHRVVLTGFMVDTRFFSLARVQIQERQRKMICAVGLEARDYITLLEAVDGLDTDVVIAAASPWSRRDDETRGQALPANVSVQRLTQYELRQLYADSALFVMPLHDVDFQAGVTALLEAMAMERAVICTRTRGQTDVVVDGVNGVYVPAQDPPALRRAIQSLLADPALCVRMGSTGRVQAEAVNELDLYAARLAAITREAMAERKDQPSSTVDPCHP